MESVIDASALLAVVLEEDVRPYCSSRWSRREKYAFGGGMEAFLWSSSSKPKHHLSMCLVFKAQWEFLICSRVCMKAEKCGNASSVFPKPS